MIAKINFITLAVTDIEKSKQFYTNAFNFTISEDSEELCLFALNDNFYLVLQQKTFFDQQTKYSVPQSMSAGFILSHNACSMEDVETIVKKAENCGAIRVRTMQEPWGYSVTIKDRDEHHWEILYTPERD